MKKLGSYLLLFSGWIACGIALYWGFNHNDQKNQKLVAKIQSVETVKQNPVGTFVDSDGREHVQYKDGSTAKIPSTENERKVYTILRDSLVPKMMLAGNDQLTEVSKVFTETKTIIKQEDLVKLGDSLRIDKWSMLYRVPTGLELATNDVLVTSRFIREGGVFGLKKTPMISFSLEKPRSRISGFEKYEMPLPVYRPIFKIDVLADYDFVFKTAKTDISTTFRIGKTNIGAFGRLNIDPFNNKIQPSYGARIVYNLVEL